jgi:dethiobiotin synthetase
MNKIIISGIGTKVGKTVISAILTTLFEGDYWKPVQSGNENNSDTAIMKHLIDGTSHRIFDPAYSFEARLAPHHAARLENDSINPDMIIPPATNRPLIIESIGGILVPLNTSTTSLDLFKTWESQWIIVSRHYLGSINHTLLTIETLKRHNISIAGIIFNGKPDPDTESAILEISKIPFLARLLPEMIIDPETIQRYAKQWQPQLSHLIP